MYVKAGLARLDTAKALHRLLVDVSREQPKLLIDLHAHSSERSLPYRPHPTGTFSACATSYTMKE